MKKYLDGILVLEGKEDASFISSFLDCEIVFTNGYEINKDNIDYLNSVNKTIYVLTDPDEAGQEIASKLEKNLKKCIFINIDFKNRKHYQKHGVAECDKEEIIKVLEPYFVEKHENCNVFDANMAYKLGLIGENSNNIRLAFCSYFHLGKCNGKQLIGRVNSMNISLDQIYSFVENYKNDY